LTKIVTEFMFSKVKVPALNAMISEIPTSPS